MRKRLIYSGFLLLGITLFLIVQSTQSSTNPADNDPAPPKITCHKRCHVELDDRIKGIYTSDECTICHGSLYEHRQINTLVLNTQLPQSITPIDHGEKDKTHVVKNQKKALMRLKGKKMVLPRMTVPAPQGMVYIPAGEFIMGSNERWDDESPEYVVYTPAYFIDKYEVTLASYKKFLDATGHPAPNGFDRLNFEKAANFPMINVRWYDAVAYAEWAGKRLPTEEEWEKAARGTDGRTYPWGMVFDPKKSNNPQSDATNAKEVGLYEVGKSPYGVYDMSGNVWEWVDASYMPHPGNKTPGEEYSEKYKLAKGGSWFNCLYYNCGISAPAYNRSFFLPTTKNNSLGFRCVKDIPPAEERTISLNIKTVN